MSKKNRRYDLMFHIICTDLAKGRVNVALNNVFRKWQGAETVDHLRAEMEDDRNRRYWAASGPITEEQAIVLRQELGRTNRSGVKLRITGRRDRVVRYDETGTVNNPSRKESWEDLKNEVGVEHRERRPQ